MAAPHTGVKRRRLTPFSGTCSMLLNDAEFHAHTGQRHMITLLVFLLTAGPAQPSADEALSFDDARPVSLPEP